MAVMKKILIMAIQVNFVPIPSEAGMWQHEFTWIVIIKIFVTDLPKKVRPYASMMKLWNSYRGSQEMAVPHFFTA